VAKGNDTYEELENTIKAVNTIGLKGICAYSQTHSLVTWAQKNHLKMGEMVNFRILHNYSSILFQQELSTSRI